MPDLIVGRRRPRRWRAARRLMAALAASSCLLLPAACARRVAAGAPPAVGERPHYRGDRVQGRQGALRGDAALLPGHRAGRAARRGRPSTAISRSSGTATWSTTSRSRRRPRRPAVRLVITRQGAAGPALDRLPGAEADLEDRPPGQAHHPAHPRPRGRADVPRRAAAGQGADRGDVRREGLPLRHAPSTRSRTSAPNEKKVVFTVDEGNRVRISDIEFEGNTVFNDSRLRWTMKNTKESALHLPHQQEGPLRSGQAPGGPRQGPRALPRRRLQERRHRRSRRSRCGRSTPSAAQGPEAADVHHHPDRGGGALEVRRGVDRGQQGLSRPALLRAFERQAERLAALQGDRRRRQGDRRRLPQHRLHLRPRRAGAGGAPGTGSPTWSSTSARATSSRSAASSSRATTGPRTRCCAASCGSTRAAWST